MRLAATVSLILLFFALSAAANRAQSTNAAGYWDHGRYVPPTPRKMPALAAGQRFVCLVPEDESPSSDKLELKDRSEKAVPWSAEALKVLTLLRVASSSNQKTLWFSLEGYSGEVQMTTFSNDATSLPWLYPVVTDASVEQLRARYEGRRVWCYPGVEVQYPTIDPTKAGERSNDLSTIYRVRHVLRLYGLSETRALGLQIGAWGGSGPTMYDFDNPVIVILDQAGRNLKWKSRNDSKVTMTLNGKPYPPPPPKELYANFVEGNYAFFADAWDLERGFNLTPPFPAHLLWPTRLSRSVLKGEVTVGMTPAMVSWAIGWPAEYGSPAQILKEKVWSYDNLQPFHFIVTFRHSKVVSAAPDGELP